MINKFSNVLLGCLAAGVIIIVSFFIGYKDGYKQGTYNGAGFALDTVQKIMRKHIASDTTVAKLHMINPDTVVYYLSRKTALGNR